MLPAVMVAERLIHKLLYKPNSSPKTSDDLPCRIPANEEKISENNSNCNHLRSTEHY